MDGIVNGRVQPRLNLVNENVGGRPVHPGVAACEAMTEAIVTITDDAIAFDHASRHFAAITRCAARLSEEMNTRAQRLVGNVLPDIKAGYEAAEIAYASAAACGD